MKRLGLALLFGLFVLVGGGMAVFGTAAGDRVMGVAVAMMFGGGGLAWWKINRRRERPLPGFQISRLPTPGGMETAFLALSDRSVLIASVLGSLTFGVAMLMLVLGTGNALDLDTVQTVVILGGGLLMIGVGLFGLVRLVNNSHFALTRRGVHAVGPAGWFVPWESIIALDEMTVHGDPFLGLRVADPDAIQMHRAQGIGRMLQRSTMGVDLSIPIRTLTVDSAEFIGAIGRYRAHPDARTRIGRADELALIRTLATPDEGTASRAQSVPEGTPRRRRSIGRILAIGSLFIVGGFCVLILADAATDDVRPGRELVRFIALIVLALATPGQLAAAILLIRNVAIGRAVAIASTVALIALFVFGLAAGNPDSRPTGMVVLAVLGAQLLLLLIAARVAAPPASS